MSYDEPFSGGGWARKIVNGIMSRGQRKASLNIGYISGMRGDDGIYRDPKLEKLDAYYENRQYDHLLPFDTPDDGAGGKIPLRQKRPRLRVAFAKTLAARVCSKLIGPTVFPALNLPEYPNDQDYLRAIVTESNLQSFLLEPTRRMLNSGEVFVRFYISSGVFKKEWYPAKYCYPLFQENGDLEEVRIQYVFEDPNEQDDNGLPKKKWFRKDLGMNSEIGFDNPDYEVGQEPEFKVVSQVDHNFGFVQGEWLTTTGEEKGYGLICDITDFIDELCYSLSQSSKAVSFNQDPQLMFNNMTDEEFVDIVRSASKGWNLGKSGEAKLLEADMSGVQVAMELRDKVRLNIQDITRIVLLDPEKIVGSAQSAKAMEVLHGPLKDLVDELRLPTGDGLKRLVLKMASANALAATSGEYEDVPIPLPPGYVPTNIYEVELKWPPIFQQTMEDLQKKVAVATQAKTAGIIAPATALKFVAEDFGVEDVEKELKDIAAAQAAEAALNPFGGF